MPYILLAANLALFAPVVNLAGALLLIAFLPGWGWAARFFDSRPGWLIAALLSYIFTMLVTLGLHYLPGPIHRWQLLLALNLAALLPLALPGKSSAKFRLIPRLPWPVWLILGVALVLRLGGLSYSEFQGDESLAMLTAAEALTGHEEALFIRAKGPGEVLLPVALWSLTGTITEMAARLPFSLAGLLAIVTVYLIGSRMIGPKAGWLAAGVFAFSGFMVAFGRIVQYQALVVWFSAAAFLMALYWQTTRRNRYALLSGLCLGAGLLAHYDAILVFPAVGWLVIAAPLKTRRQETGDRRQATIPGMTGLPPSNSPRRGDPPAGGEDSLASPPERGIEGGAVRSPAAKIRPLLLLVSSMLGVALPFYIPFYLHPQAGYTGAYVGDRIGHALRNNLPDFFRFNAFYSSFYYILLTGLLVLGLLLWLLWGRRWSRWLVGLGPLCLAVIFWPGLLTLGDYNLAIVPFALLLGGVFFALPPGGPAQALIGWLAAPFLGYNFVVALGLTHIYTIVPAWSLLAGWGWQRFFGPYGRTVNLVLGGLMLLSGLFLANAFLRHEVEYRQDYPAANLSLYWTPYDEPPATGFFGFPHRSGWKALGQKIAAGELSGDYGSNEEPDVTAWYTRHAPRACDSYPEFYFLADDLVDPVSVPEDIIAAEYEAIGLIRLANQKQLRLLQRIPTTHRLDNLDETRLARAFDRTSTPAAFVRSREGLIPLEANFGGLIRLLGYEMDTRRAYPGGRLPVTLYWQALGAVPASYQVFVHLEGEDGLAAQADGVPVCWSYPTDRWQPGQMIADQHAILIPPDTPPGPYRIQIGLYLPESFARLDVLDEAGNPAGTGLTLTNVLIEP